MVNTWFVRAGTGGALIEEYLSRGVMAIGLRGTSDFRLLDNVDEIKSHILNTLKWGKSDGSKYKTGSAKYGCDFYSKVENHDLVLLMRGADKLVAVGTVSGKYHFSPEPDWKHGNPDYCHLRRVVWSKLDHETRISGVNRRSGFGMVKGNGFGNVEGVHVGMNFANLQELCDAGIHRKCQAGIVGREKEGAESVVLSNGYIDDEDFGDEIIYTGAGGRGPKGNQIADQQFTGLNKALVLNHQEGIPVRVIRGSNHEGSFAPKSGYRYDGLYNVDEYWLEKGRDGPHVCRYRLVKAVEAQTNLPSDLPSGNEAEQADRIQSVVNRLKRDRSLTKRIKVIYDNQCQVCGEGLEVAGGLYSEAAHIKPLGRPHNGPDTLSNLLCLCPNHHVQFDNGGLFVDDEFRIVGTDRELRRSSKHKINIEHLRYHRSRWGKD
jgi:putative restriction endonuclease